MIRYREKGTGRIMEFDRPRAVFGRSPSWEQLEDAPAARSEAEGYEALSVEELKAELAERELPVSGSKAALIERLEADDGENAE